MSIKWRDFHVFSDFFGNQQYNGRISEIERMISIVNRWSKLVLPLLIFIMSSLYIFVFDSVVFKIIPMLLIISFAFLLLPKQKTTHHFLLLLGLFFCMLGDYTLQWFIVGLFCFLIGHIFYFFSFLLVKEKRKPQIWVSAIIVLYACAMGAKLIQSLLAGDDSSFIVPVIFYIVVISAMVWMAWHTNKRWIQIGSLLFLISDSILAWNLFVSNVEAATLLVMSTYYSAQFCFARSAQK